MRLADLPQLRQIRQPHVQGAPVGDARQAVHEAHAGVGVLLLFQTAAAFPEGAQVAADVGHDVHDLLQFGDADSGDGLRLHAVTQAGEVPGDAHQRPQQVAPQQQEQDKQKGQQPQREEEDAPDDVVRGFGKGLRLFQGALQFARGDLIDQTQQLVFQRLPEGAGLGVNSEFFPPGLAQSALVLSEQVANVPELFRSCAHLLYRSHQALHLFKGHPAMTHAVPAGMGKDHLPGHLAPRGLFQTVEGEHHLHLVAMEPGKALVRLHADHIELPDARPQRQDFSSHGRGIMGHAGQQGLGMQTGPPPFQRGLGQIDDGQLLAQHVQVGPGALGFQDPGQLDVLQGLHSSAEADKIGPEHSHRQQEHQAPGQHQQDQVATGRQRFVADKADHGKTLENSPPGKISWRSGSVPPPGVSR